MDNSTPSEGPSKDQGAPRQRPWASETAAPLPHDAGFTPQEHWAWARIIRGLTADLSDFPGPQEGGEIGRWVVGKDDGAGINPEQEETWPAHRTLSGRFLQTILFHEPWRQARERGWVRIARARIADPIDWTNESLDGELAFTDCVFQRRVSLTDLTARGVIAFGNCRLPQGLSASRLRGESDFFCRNGSKIGGGVELVELRIDGQMDFSGAKIEGEFNGSGVRVRSDAFFSSGFEIDGLFSIRDARIGRDLIMSTAQIRGNLQAYGVHIGGDVMLDNDFRATGEVSFRRGFVGGSLVTEDATFEGDFTIDQINIEGQAFMRRTKKFNKIELMAATIKGHLQLRESAIDGEVDMSSARIGGELHLAKDLKNSIPTWGENAKLCLRNARAAALAGGLSAFRRRGKDAKPGPFLECDLSGFRYEQIGGLGAGESGSTLASAPGNSLRAWLKTCRAKDHFDPEPYRTLARALREAGRADRAADVLNALGNYELVARGTPALKRFILLPLSWLLIGYGQRNHRAFWWFAALVLAATAIGYGAALGAPPAGPFGWQDWKAWADWAGFAFGNAIPLVTLDPAHETFVADQFCLAREAAKCAQSRIPEGLVGFFYVMKILGFVILSYLAAGLSGLATKTD